MWVSGEDAKQGGGKPRKGAGGGDSATTSASSTSASASACSHLMPASPSPCPCTPPPGPAAAAMWVPCRPVPPPAADMRGGTAATDLPASAAATAASAACCCCCWSMWVKNFHTPMGSRSLLITILQQHHGTPDSGVQRRWHNQQKGSQISRHERQAGDRRSESSSRLQFRPALQLHTCIAAPPTPAPGPAPAPRAWCRGAPAPPPPGRWR